MRHWRITAAFSLLAMAALAFGCADPTVISPFSGKPVSGDRLLAEVKQEEAKVIKDDAADKAKAEAAVRAEKAKAEAAVRKLAADAKIADAQREQLLADAVANAEVNTAAILAASADARAARDATLSALRSQAEDAFGVLEAQYAQRSGLARIVSSLPVVGQAAGSIGLGGSDLSSLLTLALGGGAVGWMNKRSKDREDRAWDESQAKLLALMTTPPKVGP